MDKLFSDRLNTGSAGSCPSSAGRSARHTLDHGRVRKLARLANQRVLGHPVYVWLLWGFFAVSLAASPMVLSDPAALSYMLDPELLVLVIAVAAVYARIELGVLWARWQRARRSRL